MDHLIWQRTDRPRPSVPYLCDGVAEEDICADAKKFCAWPANQGWDLDEIPTQTDLATRCQSWLFFGLVRVLRATQKKSFSLKDYISSIDPTQLDTNLLDVKFKSNSLGPDVSEALGFAQLWLLTWITHFEDSANIDTRQETNYFNVFWSTAMLLETISIKINQKPTDMDLRIASQIYQSSAVQRIIEASWVCPALFKRQKLTSNDTWIILAIPLSSKAIESSQVNLHATCLEKGCTAFNTSDSSYRRQHVLNCSPSRHCVSRGIDTDKLIGLVQAGKIPLVHSTFDGSTLHIDIISRGLDQDFTAISHVWAGGLGNPEANEMYECQLLSLHMAARSGPSPTSEAYYWIDTLCVPTQNKLARKIAIDDMARIYASAKSVRVLDMILQNINVNVLDPYQAATIIATSPWMTRSWTLQEAALAVKLDFQFQDKVVSLSEVDQKRVRDYQLQSLWTRDVDIINDKTEGIATAAERLLTIWRELSFRSSTKVEDIAAIIAVFIDRSAGEILSMPPEERVYALLSSQTKLPVGLLFAPSDADATTWRPKLPTYNNSHRSALQTNTFLSFTDENLLAISDVQDLYMLRSPQTFAASGTIIAQEAVTGLCFKITFAESSRHKQSKNCQLVQNDALFMLSRNAVNDHASCQTLQEEPGLFFIVRPGPDTVEIASFHRHIHWKIVTDSEVLNPTTDASLPGRNETPVCLMAEFPFFHALDPHHECQLALDVGVTWKPLSWSRKQHYPFTHHAIQMAKYLRLSEMLMLGHSFGIMFQLSLMLCTDLPLTIVWRLGDHTPVLPEILKLIASIAAIVILLCSFRKMRTLEVAHLERVFRAKMQEVWAASFSTTVQGSHQPRLTTNGTFRRTVILVLCLNIVWFAILLTILPSLLAAVINRGVYMGLYEADTPTPVTIIMTILASLFEWPQEGVRAAISSASFWGFLGMCSEVFIRNCLALSFVLKANFGRQKEAQEIPGVRDNGDGHREIDPRELWERFAILLIAALASGCMAFSMAYAASLALSAANSPGIREDRVTWALFITLAIVVAIGAIMLTIITCWLVVRGIRDGMALFITPASEFPDHGLGYAFQTDITDSDRRQSQEDASAQARSASS